MYINASLVRDICKACYMETGLCIVQCLLLAIDLSCVITSTNLTLFSLRKKSQDRHFLVSVYANNLHTLSLFHTFIIFYIFYSRYIYFSIWFFFLCYYFTFKIVSNIFLSFEYNLTVYILHVPVYSSCYKLK